ncbi:MAG TPA: AAA family ATPase [Candidatus Binataceae bacterium]|nr:AAA family ATPase [Candidatus Binataceae bacterium]
MQSKRDGKKGTLRVLLVAQEAHRAEVKASLASLGDPPLEIGEAAPGIVLRNVAAANPDGPPDVVMVAFNGNEDEALTYLQRATELSPRPVLFALLQERSPGLMKRVLRAGADEMLFLPIDPGDATRALLKISESRRREQRGEGATVISLTSLIGGTGVTTLAGNLALAMRYTLNKRVATVDLDLQAGALSIFLNADPDKTIMTLAETERKIDSLQLETSLAKHPSGIYLLAAPKRIEDSEMISEVVVGAIVDLMRQLFDYVIVDCGTHVDATKVAAWERSDHLFYVLDQSIGSARCAWRFVDLVSRLGLSGLEPKFVLSKFVASHPISEEQLAHTLAQPIYAKIPLDEKVLERAQLSAQDIWQIAPHAAVTRAVEEVARRIEGIAEADGREKSLVSRLLEASRLKMRPA